MKQQHIKNPWTKLKEARMAAKLTWIRLESKSRRKSRSRNARLARASNVIIVTREKGSNPRVFKVSNKLMSMLKALQEHSSSTRVFQKSLRSQARLFHKQQRKIASKLQNPRILSISFHTFRHWKATMEYHRTKDILYVKNLLGHKILEHTELYINLEKAIFGDTYYQEYHVKVASTPQEIKALLEVGYEYVCEKDSLLFFRKRK